MKTKPSLYTGERETYLWMFATDFRIHDLVKKCPEVLLGKHLVITAFDSGPVSPNPEEMEVGWTAYGSTMCSPRLTSLEGLSYDDYDEWYVFSEARCLDSPQIFVNYCGFSLRNPVHLLKEADPTWDIVGIKSQIKAIEELQEKFWHQLVHFSPESYIADGDNFIYVTGNQKLFEAVKTAAQKNGV